MKGKNKFDFEIEDFDRAFNSFHNQRIALYGTGRMTATLVNGLKGYHIIGLCDRDDSLIGKEVYGKPVLGRKDVEEQADILVINTSATYWNTIYRRIQSWNIPIYFRNGERARLLQKGNIDNSYWTTSYEALEAQIRENSIISFDIFDTLLVRKVLSPFDVFRIVELRLQKKYRDIDFCAVRKHAVSLLDNPTYDEIYEKIEEISGWEEDIVTDAKKLELDTEKTLIMPRYCLVELCNKVMKDKQVYFISDMYFSKEILMELLLQVGIHTKEEQIIVSCELRKDKNSGELWKWYQEEIVKGNKAIHIGDNKKSDVEMPKEYGIQTSYIMCIADMLENSSIQDIVPDIISLQSSLVMGTICTKLFNNPFVLNKTHGKVCFRDDKEAGYVLLGNLMYNFMLWLIKQVKEDKIEQLLFVAREGYLLVPQYRYMCKLLGDVYLPEAIYLEISRRAIWGATTVHQEDIYEIAKFPYDGTAIEFLKDRFGVEVEKEKLSGIPISVLQQNEAAFQAFIDLYKDEILCHMSRERRNYKAYIDSLKLKENLAVVDSVLYGTTQHYLEKLFEHGLKGYYFCAYKMADNKYFTGNNMKGCFQKPQDLTGAECAVLKNTMFSESFFTAPNGMLIKMDDNGKPSYAEDMENQKNFEIRNIMQEGIFEYFSEMVDLQKRLDITEYMTDEIFADALFGCFMNEGIEPTEEMKKSFYFDNRILNHKESRIWE